MSTAPLLRGGLLSPHTRAAARRGRGPRRLAAHPAQRTHQARWRQEAVDPGDAPHALQALLGLDGDCAQRPPEASRGHRHLDAGPRRPGRSPPPVWPRAARLSPGRAGTGWHIPWAGGGACTGGREARASVRGVRVLVAGGCLERPQRLPRELVQVRGTDGAAALGLGAAPRRGPGRRQLVEEQGGEARVLGEQGHRWSVPGARTQPGSSPPTAPGQLMLWPPHNP